MKTKVAIFPAGSEIGLEIYQALKYSTHFEVYGLSSVPCHASYVFSKDHYIEGIPFYTSENFIEEMNRIIETYHIAYIYPAYDDVQLYLTQVQDKICAKIVTSDLETVKICRSKILTYKFFKDCDFVPKYDCDREKIHAFPVFVKPDIGQGAQGTALAYNEQDLDFLVKKNPHVVICEYLPGEEYTVDCLTDDKGKLRVCRMRSRERIRSGISVSSQLLPVPQRIYEIAQEMNHRMKFCGAWFFQMKNNQEGDFRLLEVAPRIAGTMGMSRNTGVNYPLLTLYCQMGISIDMIENSYAISVDRALMSRYQTDIVYDTVYVDLDDTLIIDGKVNTTLMQYLYQTVNEEKKRILLTKHRKDIKATLAEKKISRTLFDELIQIAPEDEKKYYITEKNAVFIDDSFRERKSVSEYCQIPVFDCSEVEALLDWRVK